MKKHIIFLLLLFLFPFLIYFAKISPTVYSGDSGDLITAAALLGIPHPPGYPLYTILGHLFSLIPVNSVAFRVNLLSSFFQAATIPVIFLIIYLVTKKILPAIFGASLLAFSFTFWFYSEIAEVFALNNFFAASLILSAVFFWQTQKAIFFYLASFVLGMSLAHHQTIILIIPAIAILIYKPVKIYLNQPKKILIPAICFLLGLLPLIYFPIAVKLGSPILWDEPDSFSNFIRLISRADYGTFQSSRITLEPADGRIIYFAAFWRIFLVDFTIIGLALTLLGFIFSFLKQKKLGLFLLTGFIISGPLFLMYANFPLSGAFEISVIERFTMLPAIFAVILASIAIFYLGEIFAKFLTNFSQLSRHFRILIPLVFLTLPMILFLENWQKIDLSKNLQGLTLAEDILSNLPQNSLVMLRGDTVIFNSQYLHLVEKFRPDLKIVSPGLVASDWYYQKQLRRLYPELEFPNGNPETRLGEFIKANFSKFPITQFGPAFALEGFTWVPAGLGSWLYKDNQLPAPKQLNLENLEIWKNLTIPAKVGFADVLYDFSKRIYAEAAYRAGNFFFDQDHFEQASVFFSKSAGIDSAYLPAYQMLGMSLAKLGRCEAALVEFEKGLKILPGDFRIYQDLSQLYKSCFKNEKLASEFASKAKIARAKYLNFPTLEEF